MDSLKALDAKQPSLPALRRTRDAQLRRRRIGAWAASILFHILLFIAFFVSLKGAAVSGGEGTDAGVPQAYWVSLSGLRGGGPRAADPSQAALDALFLRVRAQQAQIPTNPDQPVAKQSLDKLFDVIDKQRPARDPSKGPDNPGSGDGQQDKGGSGASADGEKSKSQDALGHEKGQKQTRGPGDAASTGSGLWGQIAPCWGRLPQVSAVPVTLEVTLNAKGLIAAPPKIVRPDATAPSEARLISEARALAALSACVPYHAESLATKGSTFTVDFGREPHAAQ